MRTILLPKLADKTLGTSVTYEFEYYPSGR